MFRVEDVRENNRAGLLISSFAPRTALTALVLIELLGLLVAPVAVNAQTASFQGLGQMPGTMAGGGTYVNAVSADGSTIVGYTWIDGSSTVPFKWTAAGGYQNLGNLGRVTSNDRAYGVSSDGSVIVGQAGRPDGFIVAFRWTAAGGMQELPMYSAAATSANGAVAVGMEFRWTAPGQIDSLGFLGGNNYTSAHGVSGDGQTVAGYSETSPNRYAHAFRWTPATGIQDLGVTTGTESIAWGISSDGTTIFGEARDSGQFWRAFRWTSSLGMRDMGTMGGPMSTSHGASANGAVIVGKSLITSSSGSLRAFRWTAPTGMRDLRQELLNAGVTAVQNWILAVAAGVSDDGSVIAGWGYPASLTPAQPFIAVLPVAGGGGGGATLSSLSLNPSTVTGGNPSTGTVTLSAGAPSGGAVVALASGNPAVASVPSSVAIPAGATSASFTIATAIVSANISVTISGTYNGTTRNATLNVNKPPTPGTPSLLSPANGATPTQPVAFDWTDASAAVSYTIQIDDSSSFSSPFVANQSVTVSAATIGGLPSQQLWWRVRGVNAVGAAGSWSSTRTFTPQGAPVAPSLSSLTLNPTSVVGGNTSQGTVTLTGAAPAGGATVTLSSSDPNTASLPASVTVPAGASSANFAVATTSVSASSTVTISGLYAGVTKSGTLTVTPPSTVTLSSLTLNPTSVRGGNSSTGTVTLSATAPSGGVVINLSSSNTNVATVPTSVTVPAGQTSKTFNVSTQSVSSNTTVNISASHNSVIKTSTLTVTSGWR